MTPEQIPARETAAFVAAHLKKGARLLDVGCGQGHLAALLQREGFDVTAIDKDEGAVKKAKANGVGARRADLLKVKDGPYDALLFSRVFHHLTPLPEVTDKAHALLKPGGFLCVEDFDFERMNEVGATWFYGLERVLEVGQHLSSTLHNQAA